MKKSISGGTSRQKRAVDTVRALTGAKPLPVLKTVRWEIYNSLSGPLQIVDNGGAAILQLGPHERLEIDGGMKAQLEASSHFKGLQAQNRVRLV